LSEWLDPTSQEQIETAFKPARLFDIYGASEFPLIAFQCRHRWLHLNADWLILEPVDDHYRPVEPGQTSQTVLLTNLANHIQPIIRYDLGDRVMLKPDPCPCGSSLPAIRVEGRRDDVLSFRASDGKIVQFLPMAIETVIETTEGVHRYQLIQTGGTALRVRLEAAPGREADLVWEVLIQRLQDYLAAQGLPFIEILRALEPPRPDPVSGKFRQIWKEINPL
jgi:phenylacetate-coenzyme A ligase PaaK-like adenylate-forming protein